MAKRDPRTLVIVRHAHRSKQFGSEADNGLSERGRTQAQRVLERFAEVFGGKTKPKLLSSPKIRCVETLLPLSRELAAPIERASLLDEGGNTRKKAKELAEHWLEGEYGPLVVACSHGDVIPDLLDELVKAPIDLDKGGWAVVEEDDEGEVSLRELLQEP